MSKLVRAGILALAIVPNSSNVGAITLRTLLENQVAAGSALQADAELRLQEAAILNMARDIQELSFAQVKEETGTTSTNTQQATDPDPFDVEQGFVELAKQLVELSGTGQLGTLRECLIDVANGTYETSVAAKLAAGTLSADLADDGLQNVDVLVRKTDNLLLPGQSITGIHGETLNVSVATPPVDDQAAVQDATGDNAEDSQQTEDGQTNQDQEGDSAAVSDNTEGDGANVENLQVEDADANVTTDGSADTGDDAPQTVAVADEVYEPPDDEEPQSWFTSWM